MRARGVTILPVAGVLLPACQREAPDEPEVAPAGAAGRSARDLETWGRDRDAAVRVAPGAGARTAPSWWRTVSPPTPSAT